MPGGPFRGGTALVADSTWSPPCGQTHVTRSSMATPYQIVLHFIGPPVPISARVHSTPQRRRPTIPGGGHVEP
eukprot:5740259-Pyramimonas_sp.AAC.2